MNNYLSSAKTESYHHYGKKSKEKILLIISTEEITLKKSFEHAINKTASYQRMKLFNNNEESYHHLIVVPTFTDNSDIEQAIILAHELGHFYAFKNASKLKKIFMTIEFKTTTYMTELFAWQKALKILEQEGIIAENGNKLQRQAYQDYLKIKRNGLQSYGHPASFIIRGTINTIIQSLQLLIASYLIVALLFIFKKNAIPIPIFEDVIAFELEHFYSHVLTFFSLMIFAFIFKITAKFIFTICCKISK